MKNNSNIRKDEHMNVVVVLERLFVLGLINEYEYSKSLALANRFSSKSFFNPLSISGKITLIDNFGGKERNEEQSGYLL